MATKFRSIKEKLRLYFGVYLLLTSFVVGIVFVFYEKKESIESITELLSDLQIKIQKIGAVERDFFTFETINPVFYETGKSDYLKERKQLLFQIQNDLQKLQKRKELRSIDMDDKLFRLKKQVAEYEVLFERLVELIQRRGFKDYGKEGQMREFIHTIENSEMPFNMEQLLMIRRHEKDFIIRKEEVYINKLSSVVQSLRKDIRNQVMDDKKRKEMLTLLRNYHYAFLDVVDYERQIGLDVNSGMRFQVQNKASQIAEMIENLNEEGELQALQITYSIRYTLIGVVVLCLVLWMVMSYLISKKLSLPVRELSKSIYDVIQNDFSQDYKIKSITTNDEIGWLSKDFDKMYNKIRSSLLETREKNIELSHTQTQVMDSIRYARQIQEAVLPSLGEFNQFFADSFVFYKPQKLVSGDFYWIFRKKRKTFVAVVDCTGHGVPGAFMSMIGHTLLNKIIGQSKIYDPAMILEVLHLEIQHALKQQDGVNDDGMEVAICAIEQVGDEREVTFAGAHRPLFYTNKDKILKVKGNKRSIGGRQKQESKPFITSILHLQKGDLLYLATDGFADQHNEERLKYGSQQLFDFLEKIRARPLATQRINLEEEFERFKANQEQRDDATILGLKL